MLEIKDLCKQYPTRAEPLCVLRGVNLQLQPGQALAITGPSGSGKSTLLHILGTLDRPTSGSVEFHGQDPFQLGERALARFRNLSIGFVFQDHHLLPQCSVLENVLIPRLAMGSLDAVAIERARQWVERVGLKDRFDHRPAELSGGEKQRVAVARALMNQPQLLLADEPTGNLDRATAATIGSLLLELRDETQATLIVVTHSLDLASRFPLHLELDQGTLARPRSS